MKIERHQLTDREIWMGIMFGKFKCYRKYKGGTWTLVEGFPQYWTNREPFDFELSLNHVYRIERYDDK